MRTAAATASPALFLKAEKLKEAPTKRIARGVDASEKYPLVLITAGGIYCPIPNIPKGRATTMDIISGFVIIPLAMPVTLLKNDT